MTALFATVGNIKCIESTSCKKCEMGRYRPYAYTDGKYFDENDVNFNGLASDSINDCAICSAGKYMDSIGATECTLCDQGANSC